MSAITHFKTESERHFATYLDGAEHAWDYEPEIPGHTKRPDFRIIHGSIELLSDVKQRSPTEFIAGCRSVDPITGIRKLIEKGREKFKTFVNHTCALILYNAGDQDTWLEPHCIFEAMLGDGGITLNFSPESGTADPNSAQSVFLPRGGKMIKHYSTMEPHSSTQNISAVVALKPYRIPNPQYEEIVSDIIARQPHLGRPLTVEERCEVRCDLILGGMPATIGDTFGLSVCDNPFAKRSLPSDVFNGDFDERWSLVDGALTKVFVGKELPALEPVEIVRDDNSIEKRCPRPNST
jgi:hypothetical protein